MVARDEVHNLTDDVKTIRYAELSINPCSRTYGSAPCTAALGVTGDFKCYNSPRSCQDPANYLAGDEQVIRWAMPTGSTDISINHMPSITAISRRPARLSPGESLGVRESVTVSFGNHAHNDVGFDNYAADRTGNPYNKGTFWGKFFSRWGSLEGNAFRTIDGCIGQSLDQMVTRHYVVDSVSGPDSSGRVSITAKDVIKFFDSKKAQAPAPSGGSLLSAISDVDGALVLTPAGIGNLEYPSSGTASIGDERVSFGRINDAVSLTRGVTSTAEAHEAGETFQLALTYTAQDASTIINDLITNYTSTPADYINLAEWDEEVANYLPRLYTAQIMRPTSVKKLLDELIREIGLTFYTDMENKKLVLKAFRSLVPTFDVNDTFALNSSIKSKRLDARRVDQMQVYYAKYNPLEEQDQKKNYRSIYADVSGNAIVALEENPPAIRDILSRWIPVAAFSTVQDLTDNMLTRYETAPREVSFSVRDKYPVTLGESVTIQSRLFENQEGDLELPFSAQVVSIDKKNGFISAIAEELPEGIGSDPIRIINIDADIFNINLRDLHDSLYIEAQSGDTVKLIVSPNAVIGSTSPSATALDIGSWNAGVIIEVGGTGRIAGAGGRPTLSSGGDGGTALTVSFAITIIDDIEIFSGGGAGAALFDGGVATKGGAGAGLVNSGGGGVTKDTGGVVTTASGTSTGGDPGDDGSAVSPSPSGLKGDAIDGVSNVTILGGAVPDIRGNQIG